MATKERGGLLTLVGYKAPVIAEWLISEEHPVKGPWGFTKVTVFFLLTVGWLYPTGFTLPSTSASQEKLNTLITDMLFSLITCTFK